MKCRVVVVGRAPALKGGISLMAAMALRHAKSLDLEGASVFHSRSRGSASRYILFTTHRGERVKIRMSDHYITNSPDTDFNFTSLDGRSGIGIVTDYITERACGMTGEQLAAANALRRINAARHGGKVLNRELLTKISAETGLAFQQVCNLAGVAL